MSNTEKAIRQGDVVFTKVGEIPPSAKKLDTKILQESETTGHHHHFKPTAPISIFQVGENPLDNNSITPDLQKYVEVTEAALLYHGKGFDPEPYKTKTGDHHALRITPGLYEINIIREYDHESNEVRPVID